MMKIKVILMILMMTLTTLASASIVKQERIGKYLSLPIILCILFDNWLLYDNLYNQSIFSCTILVLLADATPRYNETFLNGTENINNRNLAREDSQKPKDPFAVGGILFLLWIYYIMP